MTKFQRQFVIFLMVVAYCTACMIINCPRGGKRSSQQSNELLPLRHCARCGPNNSGHCYGPNICCGSNFGCLMGTSDTKPCEEEAASPDPCVDTRLGPKCPSGQGFCATSDICCTQETCQFDSSCHYGGNDHKNTLSSDINFSSHRHYMLSLMNAYLKSQNKQISENTIE